jgi:hypothetical protein
MESVAAAESAIAQHTKRKRFTHISFLSAMFNLQILRRNFHSSGNDESSTLIVARDSVARQMKGKEKGRDGSCPPRPG